MAHRLPTSMTFAGTTNVSNTEASRTGPRAGFYDSTYIVFLAASTPRSVVSIPTISFAAACRSEVQAHPSNLHRASLCQWILNEYRQTTHDEFPLLQYTHHLQLEPLVPFTACSGQARCLVRALPTQRKLEKGFLRTRGLQIIGSQALLYPTHINFPLRRHQCRLV